MIKFLKKHLKKSIYFSVFGIIIIFGINLYVKSVTKSLIYTSKNELPKTNVGIIFGAGINGNNPSKYLKDRLDAGIELFHSKKINKILKFRSS